MPSGGFLQLVAYGDINKLYYSENLLNRWNGFDTRYKRNKIGECRFFYNKKHCKSNPKIETKQEKIIRESGYVYNQPSKHKSINVFKNQPTISLQTVQTFSIRPLSVREKAIKNWGENYIKKWEKYIEIKGVFDEKFGRFFQNTNQIQYFDKRSIIKRVNCIDFRVKRMSSIIDSSIQLQQYIFNHLYLQQPNFLFNINCMVQKHKHVVANYFGLQKQSILKNIECPITYTEITDLYIECETCKTCYDYILTEHYFKNNPICACCRDDIDIEPLSLSSHSEIYLLLKSF